MKPSQYSGLLANTGLIALMVAPHSPYAVWLWAYVIVNGLAAWSLDEN